jgi:predicted dehydrogenase
MSSGLRLTRRDWLKGVAAASIIGPYVISDSALGAGDRPAPSNRLGIGSIGTGGQGGGHVRGLLEEKDVQVMAICDVDTNHREEKKKWVEERYSRDAPGTYAGCSTFTDFRKVLDRPDIDAVLIAAPDHWHALISAMAAKAGKDIYCEKPMAARIGEGRIAADTVKRYARVFQTGSQERSGGSRFAWELIRNGYLGKIHTIRTYLPMEAHCLAPQGDASPKPVPEGFDYNMWLGPAPWAPYTEKRCHFNFRWILDYSDGELTDRGAHVNDIALWVAQPFLKGPVEIVATEGKFRDDTLWDVPIHFHIEYTYANGLKIICESGGQRGIKFEGTEGWIFSAIHGGALTAEPASLLKTVLGPRDIQLGRSKGHRRDWLDAVKTRGATVAPAEDGHRTASFCHLGVIALLTGRKLTWDLEKEQFINDSGANSFVTRPMRAPWHL